MKVKCPRPKKKVNNPDEHIKTCSRCPYVIWDEPKMVAGFMASMCGVRVGSIGMAAELDVIGEKLTGVARFTKQDGDVEFKLRILKLIRSHARNNGWRIDGFSRKETLEQLDSLIEFCKRAEAKGLSVYAWA